MKGLALHAVPCHRAKAVAAYRVEASTRCSFAVVLLARLGVALILAAFRVDAPMLSRREDVLRKSVGAFVGCYFLVGGGSFGARTVAISRQTVSAAFGVTSGL
jgi:hypothetical protein